ncbi:BlaI/MecI/CopY family transcriptional regulator [Teredinibacter waterburyi]|uniref:BlaI/MecI/CopY family transcriptional regulator n=1 Tax=Teredinibacter waterburyi TaxID=1500538 RepID=UPI00165F66FD|nr:BlaI/MecI/CopY family transcriptional regulator [Teredinibacter waterburyi]
MPPLSQHNLSRRERQIMDILYEMGSASAHDVQARLPNPPGYSAVRALIARLVEKDIVSFKNEGPKYIYSPKVGEKKASQSAIQRLIKTFFKGSPVQAVNALLDMEGDDLSAHEIEQLERNIARIKALKK